MADRNIARYERYYRAVAPRVGPRFSQECWLNMCVLQRIEKGLGGIDLEMVDTTDYRDVFAELTLRPDPHEESEFAPMKDERSCSSIGRTGRS